MDTFRKSEVTDELLLDECSKCTEFDIVDCNEIGCPHKFPEAQKAETTAILRAFNNTRNKRKPRT